MATFFKDSHRGNTSKTARLSPTSEISDLNCRFRDIEARIDLLCQRIETEAQGILARPADQAGPEAARSNVVAFPGARGYRRGSAEKLLALEEEMLDAVTTRHDLVQCILHARPLERDDALNKLRLLSEILTFGQGLPPEQAGLAINGCLEFLEI